jgi:hypothetical protein
VVPDEMNYMATTKIEPNKATTIIDSRHLKILSVKKEQLKDAVVFVCFDEMEDQSFLQKTVEEIDKIEPSAVYFSGGKECSISIFDKQSTKNKDIVVSVQHRISPDENQRTEIEKQVKFAFSNARNVSVIHSLVEDVSIGTI